MTDKKSINEFIIACTEQDRKNGHSCTEWNKRLKQAGYHRITFSSKYDGVDSWRLMHRWCEFNIGKDHYTWVGNVFWFENEKDATMFSLRWS